MRSSRTDGGAGRPDHRDPRWLRRPRSPRCRSAALPVPTRASPAPDGTPEHAVTTAIRTIPGALAKDGAEGVFAVALADGSVTAVKIADGAG